MINKIIHRIIYLLNYFTKEGKESRINEKIQLDWIESGIDFNYNYFDGSFNMMFDTKKQAAKEIMNFTKFYAQTMQSALQKDERCKNYLELNMTDFEGRKLSLCLVKHGGKTPHMLREELQLENDNLKKENEILKNKLKKVAPQPLRNGS